MYKTIKENITSEIVEKKSRFICNLFYVRSESEAEEIIKQVKRKYYDAKHNCFAFCVMEGKKIVKKSNDDGEPTGTAGVPMLNILEKNNICNVLIIVTRYFGGVLLGTGGLLRAYSKAALEAFKYVEIISEEPGIELYVEILYSDLEKFKYYCKNKNINIVNIDYNNIISSTIEVNEEEKKQIIENSNFKVLKSKVLKQKSIKK